MNQDLTDLFGLRINSAELVEFRQAARVSGMKPQEAMRLAITAMNAAYRRYGRIPRDMEIRQKVFDQAEPIKEAV